jgi:hypothetical protein
MDRAAESESVLIVEPGKSMRDHQGETQRGKDGPERYWSARIRVERPERGDAGIHGLMAGSGLSLRLWRDVPPGRSWMPGRSSREKLGYVISGVAELISERGVARLERGMTWHIPAGVTHTYRILASFTAVEAMAPRPG